MNEIEVRPEVIQQTQKILGKYVKKPQLTEKLLKKPPFRFLHDVIRMVIQETGFLKGLYSAEELVSENVKDREKKIAFLNKLIDATKAVSGIELTVKASKIVAGLEPTQTNLLLQAIGKAIDKKLDTSQYVQQLKKSKVKSESDVKTKKVSETNLKKLQKSKDETAKKNLKVKKESSKIISPKDKQKKEDRKGTEKTKKGDVSPKVAQDSSRIKKHEQNEDKVKEVVEKSEVVAEKTEEAVPKNSDNVKEEESSEIKNNNITETEPVLIRPKSAKPKSASLKQKEIKDEIVEEKEANSSSLRPPSVRPSSARPGAPRLRPDSALPLKEPITMGKINVIIENFDKIDDRDDEETVIIENTTEEIEETKPKIELQEKGQLVEEILKQIGDEDVIEKTISNNEWQINGLKNKNLIKEMDHLRNSIQTLTRIANPFGKLISYLHEDVETMYNELNMWKNMKRQTFIEIKKQEKNTEELCVPLKEQLNNLDSAIKKQQEDILAMRAKILRNNTHIQQTISQFV